MYQAIFSGRAEKAFLGLPEREARLVKEAIEKLKRNPRAHGTIKLKNAPVASYRYRAGNNRILFDVDDERKVIELLDIKKRDEHAAANQTAWFTIERTWECLIQMHYDQTFDKQSLSVLPMTRH